MFSCPRLLVPKCEAGSRYSIVGPNKLKWAHPRRFGALVEHRKACSPSPSVQLYGRPFPCLSCVTRLVKYRDPNFCLVTQLIEIEFDVNSIFKLYSLKLGMFGLLSNLSHFV
jgi:hypothetical protein